jgi:hypothetical protein
MVEEQKAAQSPTTQKESNAAKWIRIIFLTLGFALIAVIMVMAVLKQWRVGLTKKGELMGLLDLFKSKPKIVKEIEGGTWGHLIREHGLNVDELTKNIRCVDKPGRIDGIAVSLLRIFSLKDIEKKGITVSGWETFDQHPDLIMFEGYINTSNKAHLEKKTRQ